MALPEVPPSTVLTEADERRSARGGAFSMFVDSFDVYLPALVLPAAMAYFMPANLSPAIRATFTTLLFTIGLLARPIGSVIFGNLSDRIGRKPVTMISGWGFTIVTLLIGLLPGYAAWDYGAIAVFAVLRLIGGIFLAGGYAAPIPLALEQAKPARRGRVGGLIGVGAPGSFLVINLLLLGLLDVLPHGGFLAWGWRIPFFLGFVLGLVYLWHYRGVKEDDSVFAAAPQGTATGDGAVHDAPLAVLQRLPVHLRLLVRHPDVGVVPPDAAGAGAGPEPAAVLHGRDHQLGPHDRC